MVELLHHKSLEFVVLVLEFGDHGHPGILINDIEAIAFGQDKRAACGDHYPIRQCGKSRPGSGQIHGSEQQMSPAPQAGKGGGNLRLRSHHHRQVDMPARRRGNSDRRAGGHRIHAVGGGHHGRDRQE
jgi:hypothetical protein